MVRAGPVCVVGVRLDLKGVIWSLCKLDDHVSLQKTPFIRPNSARYTSFIKRGHHVYYAPMECVFAGTTGTCDDLLFMTNDLKGGKYAVALCGRFPISFFPVPFGCFTMWIFRL